MSENCAQKTTRPMRQKRDPRRPGGGGSLKWIENNPVKATRAENIKLFKIYKNRFLDPKRLQDPHKTLQPRKQGAISSPPRAPCWKDFGAMLAPRATKRPLKKHTKSSLIWKSIFHRFFIDFGRVLWGSWTQVGLQNKSKIGSRCWPNFERFLNNFLLIFTRSWAPENLNFNVFASARIKK